MKLTTVRSSIAKAQKAAIDLKSFILDLKLNIIIEGPAPAFHEKYQNKYRWQLIIKSPNRSNLIDIITTLPSNWSFDIDPDNLL